MWKLDNKIRTCLLALCGTYQYRNLIPESVSPLPWFRAFTIDLITGLSGGAPTTGLAGGAVFDRGAHGARSRRCSRSTKDPLCQHWGSWRRAEHCREQSSKQTAPKWPLSLHRNRSFRAGPSAACTPAEPRQGNVIQVEDTHLLETHRDVSQVLAVLKGGCYFYRC